MMDYEDDQRVLYVGNLDRRVDEGLIKDIFSKIGLVKRCKMINETQQQASTNGVHRGHTSSDPYCFVEFDNHKDALLALQTMNGRKVLEKAIKVNWASNSGMKRDTSNHYHIFVGDLCPTIDTKDLINLFAPCGTISDARVVKDTTTGKSKGYGFISFERKMDADSAMKKMNGSTINGKQLRINWASRKPSPVSQSYKPLKKEEVTKQASPYNSTVYVGNLPSDASEARLREVFSAYGTINGVRVFPEKGYAFVMFTTHNDAVEAICGLHGKDLDGNILKCSWGKEPANDINTTMAWQQYYYQCYLMQQQQQHQQQQPQQAYMPVAAPQHYPVYYQPQYQAYQPNQPSMPTMMIQQQQPYGNAMQGPNGSMPGQQHAQTPPMGGVPGGGMMAPQQGQMTSAGFTMQPAAGYPAQ